MNIWYFLMGMAMVAALFRLVERMNEFGKGYDRVPDVEEGGAVRSKVKDLWMSFHAVLLLGCM